MDLTHQILKIKPREESGSTTSRKYAYQYDLSLYMLLNQHDKLDDYIYLFDFHEDLVVLNSSIKPDKIDFYQIKSKDTGNWTINALTKAEKGKLSIIGKLYLNKINFPKNTNSLNFVSNAPFSIKELKSKEDSLKKIEINASELDKNNLEICIKTLNTEHSPILCDEFEKITKFKVTNLSNKDSSTHCLGELTKLIHKINPNNKINPQLAYNQIIGEVSKRTRSIVTDKNLENLDDLIEVKGITKFQFLEFLNKAGLYKSVEEEWNEIKPLLENSSIGAIELLKYKNAWRNLSMKLISEVGKIPLMNLKNEIENLLNEAEKTAAINDKTPLLTILEYLHSKLKPNIYDDYFVKCLSIKILYERY
jgi:hypothetical protein